MSDLSGDMSGSARAANGGSRAASGPVPVSQPYPSGMRTPRDIMNLRQAREAKKREVEAAAAQGQRDAQTEERRRSLERRAAAGVGGSTYRRTEPGGGAGDIGDIGYIIGQPLVGGVGMQGTAATARVDPSVGPQTADPPVDARRPPDRPPDVYRASQADPASLPVGGATRTLGAPIHPQEQSELAVPEQTAATYAARTQQPSTRKAKQPAGTDPTTQAQAGPSAAPPAVQPHSLGDGAGRSVPRNPGVSTFPHAFERWETLSSHWEGLTSYWIRRLEQNTEELKRDPLASQMSRQITDLSAAGANLFHAVVELQRLRASSERKFQRWFFETRSENERAQEIQGELEKALRLERQARAEDRRQAAVAIQERKNAERLLAEMGRELQISKEEARRAWEELGRREQEERDRTLSLREGQPTLVGGVQVVPMAGGSRHGSVRDRPPTREGPAVNMPSYNAVSAQIGQERGTGSPVHSEQSDEYDPDAHSPTDTDPFTEQGRRAGRIPPLHHEPGLQTLVADTHQPYPLGSAPAISGSTAQTVVPAHPAALSSSPPNYAPQPSSSTPIPQGASVASSGNLFYRHGGTFLHSDSSPQASQPPQVRSRRGTNPSEADDRSYVPSLDDPFSEEGDDEYEIDEHGHIRRDERGYPIPYGRGPQSTLQRSDTNESDDSDVREALERERAHAQRYGSGAQGSSQAIPPQLGAGPVLTAAGPGGYGQGYVQAPDYSGAGYGGWEGVQIHHHPTRLSDVLEEDERSRASESRGAF